MIEPRLAWEEAAIARRLSSVDVPDDTAGMAAAVAAYRGSRAGRRRRPRPLMLRFTTVVTAVVMMLSGGMAAAYAASLPDPVQRVVHHLLAPVGVPGPHHARADRKAVKSLERSHPEQLLRHHRRGEV